MSDDVWTIGAALEWTQGYLERKGDENPRISAQWLLSFACGLSRIELYANFDKPLSLDERAVLRDYVARRGNGEPLQYITGEVGFRYITVQVRSGVLIPRPETEVLVSEALALLPTFVRRRVEESEGHADSDNASDVSCEASLPDEGAGDQDDEAGISRVADSRVAEQKPLLVADLCTGSGCIACSLAYEHPLVQVVATDISSEAIALAQQNATALGLADRVEFIECDLGEGVAPDFVGTFDLVISNPPYVPTNELACAPQEVVDFEPALALDGGADGLDVVRRMLPWCFDAVKPDGHLALELYETSFDAAVSLVKASGFSDVRIVEDLAGHPRVLICCKKSEV